jgi:hypothetical protein
MNRIEKENVLLQSMMALVGVTLLITGTFTVFAAWRGPQPNDLPALNSVSTTQPTDPSAKPIPVSLPADEEPAPAEECDKPADAVALDGQEVAATAEDIECLIDEFSATGDEHFESL